MGYPPVQFDDEAEFLVEDITVCTPGSEYRSGLALAFGQRVPPLDVADVPELEE
jgi:hypothetical protein